MKVMFALEAIVQFGLAELAICSHQHAALHHPVHTYGQWGRRNKSGCGKMGTKPLIVFWQAKRYVASRFTTAKPSAGPQHHIY